MRHYVGMGEDLDDRLRAAATSVDVDKLLDLGCALADIDRPRDAEAYFLRASDLGSPAAAFNLGNSLADQERWLEAVAVFELALERGQNDAWLNLGLVLHELGDLAGEIRAYAKAEEAGDSGGSLRLAFALREQRDRETAMAAAQRSASAGNETAAAVVACWQWCLTQDPSLEAALRAGADHFPAARADLGDLLLATGRVEEARQIFEHGMKLCESESMLTLGNLYTDFLGDDDAAEVAYRAGAKLGDAHAHHNLAVLLESQDDLEGAERHYRLAIERGDTLAIAALRELLKD
jgi:tetratricopeptide (TPR) repeat protein